MREELVEFLQDKYVFFDFDGTLCEYRYNGHIFGDEGCGGQTLEELTFENVYSDVRPLKTMLKYIRRLASEQVYVLGAIVTSFESLQKYIWLNKNFSPIKRENVYFVADSSLKVKTLLLFADRNDIRKRDIVLVDDKHSTLVEAEKAGFVALHTSSFMD